jgi:hypothetical protein
MSESVTTITAQFVTPADLSTCALSLWSLVPHRFFYCSFQEINLSQGTYTSQGDIEHSPAYFSFAGVNNLMI